jgi:hypothetical protein
VANPNGRTGRDWENRVIAFLSYVYPKMERRRLHGKFDRGEFINTGKWAFECKNTKTINLSAALNEAQAEAKNAGVPYHAAIINRRNHDIRQAYVIMSLAQFKNMLRDIEGLA